MPRSIPPSLREGRLANVAGVVLCARGASRDAVSAAARLLEPLCEDVLVVGASRETGPPSGSAADRVPGRPLFAPDDSALAQLAAALAAATAARVLVVEPSGELPSPALLLALTAWPESDAVVSDRGGLAGASAPMRGAILRREPALAAARLRLAAGERDTAGLLAQLAAVALDPADLAAITGSG